MLYSGVDLHRRLIVICRCYRNDMGENYSLVERLSAKSRTPSCGGLRPFIKSYIESQVLDKSSLVKTVDCFTPL